MLILAIVLPIVLTNKDDPHPTPAPLPYYNPYKIGDIVELPANLSGIIRAGEAYNSEHHMHSYRALMSKLSDGHPLKKGVETAKIPLGKNNQFARNLKFTFDQPDWRVSHLVLSDSDHQRFSIPEQAVKKPTGVLDKRLEMTGFSLFDKEGSFGFDFSDPLTGDSFINT